MPKGSLELQRLKTEILEYLRSVGLPVFYCLGIPGDEGFIFWDHAQYPDWRQFIDVAKESGARMFLFSSRDLTLEELQTAREALEEVAAESSEREDAVAFLDSLHQHVGHGAWVRVAWQQDGRRFAYERVAPWYENLLDLLDELSDHLPDLDDEEDNDEPGSRGGYYPLN